MKIQSFTRPTTVAAIEFLGEALTQAQFDQLVIRLELENEIPSGPSKSVTAKSVLLAHITNRHPTQIVSTLNGPMTLSEAVVHEAVEATMPKFANKIEQERFLRGLALDGYVIFRDEHSKIPALRRALPEEIDLPATDDEVHQLLKHFGFLIPQGHLDQAIAAHTRGNWAAANSQIRTFLESLISEIASNIDPQKSSELSSSENYRCWLAEQGFLSTSNNEWTRDGKNYLNGLFKMLHTDGSHPGLSDEEHSTFRLHLSLITSRVLLRRLNNIQNHM